MKDVLKALKALVLSVWENEPTLVVGVVTSLVVAGLAVVGLTVPVAAVATAVTVVLGALVTRLNVTPAPKKP